MFIKAFIITVVVLLLLVIFYKIRNYSKKIKRKNSIERLKILRKEYENFDIKCSLIKELITYKYAPTFNNKPKSVESFNKKNYEIKSSFLKSTDPLMYNILVTIAQCLDENHKKSIEILFIKDSNGISDEPLTLLIADWSYYLLLLEKEK